MMDAVYIAFAMPINAAFCPLLPGELTWCSAIDLAAGEGERWDCVLVTCTCRTGVVDTKKGVWVELLALGYMTTCGLCWALEELAT